MAAIRPVKESGICYENAGGRSGIRPARLGRAGGELLGLPRCQGVCDTTVESRSAISSAYVTVREAYVPHRLRAADPDGLAPLAVVAPYDLCPRPVVDLDDHDHALALRLDDRVSLYR